MSDKLLNYFNGDSFAASTWQNKYALKDNEGNPIEETPEDMHHRLAREFARIENTYNDDDKLTEEEIFELFKDFKYVIPGGSVLSGLGSKLPVSLSNCFVIESPNDSYDSIMTTRNYQCQLMKRRGGVGYDLSELRPRGARVNNAAVTSTGAASFMEGNSAITNEVAQSGRRGALMLSISIVHPDIEEFIEKKQDLTKVTGANISVKVNDSFMQAVENDSDFLLRFPIGINIDESKYMTDEYPYDVLIDIGDNEPTYNKCYIKKVNAKRLWEKLTHCAWNTAEPGVIFEDRMHDYAPDGVYEDYKMVSTNPCVAGDTIIKTNVGDMTIKELVDLYEKGHSNFMVESWNLTRYVAEMQAIKFAVLTQRDANLLKIVTESGNEIRVTQDHMIYVVKEGYQEAKNLKKGEELLVFDKKTNIYTPSKIVSITQDGIEDVYDIGVEFNHNFFANGILVHNCGEIGMNKDSCRLIAMNLSGYVEKPYTHEAKFNFELFKNHVYKTLKLGDDLVDLELEQVNKILSGLKEKDVAERDIWSLLKGTAIDVRRMGLGFTGLGDMFAMMGMKYGSNESLEFIDTVLDVMFKSQLEGTIKLAKSRGKFNKFNAKLEGGEDLNTPQNSFFKMIHRKYPELWDEMMIHGRRNISWSTLAPCGTLSIMTRTTSGVEPLFMPFYERKRKCVNATDRVDYIDKVGEKYTLFVIVHNGLKQWAHINKGISMEELDNYNIAQWQELYEQSPYFGACAQELDWHTRNSMQGAIQNYITHSISSCVTEDTLIVTDKGLMYLDELCNVSNISENTFVKNEDKVNVFSHDKKMHLISSYYNNGVKDVYELELANGLILRCTNNEKFLKYDDNTNMVEWKELKTLESGDLIEIF